MPLWLPRDREKFPKNPIGEKSDFLRFPELHQVPYGTPKMTPKNSKMIQTSTHNIFLRISSIRLPSPSWGLPLGCLWARIRNGQRAPKTAPRGDSTTPGSPWRPNSYNLSHTPAHHMISVTRPLIKPYKSHFNFNCAFQRMLYNLSDTTVDECPCCVHRCIN